MNNSSRASEIATQKPWLSAFFGVRKNSAYQEDIARLTPLHVVIVGLVAVIVFVVALIVLVRHVVAA